MLYRTRFENEISSLLEYETPPVTPAKQTLYLPIDLNAALKGKKVGAHVTKAAAGATIVDVIVYFHGVISVCGSEKQFIEKGVEFLWSTPPFDKMRSDLDASGRAALLLVPRLDSEVGKTGTGTKHYGDLHKDKAFDSLVTKAFAELKGKAIRPDVKIGKVVLAAHSGGGSPMAAILRAKNDLRAKIRACWGFECLYPGAKPWLDWLKEDALLRFRHYRQECVFSSEARALRGGPKDGFIDTLTPADTDAHCNLIQNFWREAISHMPKDADSKLAF